MNIVMRLGGVSLVCWMLSALFASAVFAASPAGPSCSMAETAYGYFTELSKIPRCSHDEKAASDYLASFGRKLKLETVQDASRNVLIKKPGSTGREAEPPVILQAHMDMVCVKTSDSNHDFSKDPIEPVLDGDWVRAVDTTLGADNGNGVALIMAVLASGSLSHPPLEAVFTTDEEDGMSGAANLDFSRLAGRRLINVDSEEEGVFTVGCAAHTHVDVAIPIAYEAAPQSAAAYTLMVKGLAGGHSGVDIGKGRANANVLAARLLSVLDGTGFQVSSVNGGAKRNAIPQECSAVILFAKTDPDAVTRAIAQTKARFKSEYPSEQGLSISLARAPLPAKVMTRESLQRVLDGILRTPNGVLSMSADIAGLVQTSNNLGVIITDAKTVTLQNYPRSSVVSEQAETIKKLLALAGSTGARAEVSNEAPAWPYKVDSRLHDTMAGVFRDLYVTQPVFAAIHAGLECAMFAAKRPEADMVSIGPDIEGAHTPGERMSFASFTRICDFLVKVLEQL